MSPIHDQSYRRYKGERIPLGRNWAVIASTGMSGSEVISDALATFSQKGTAVALLHCVSVYPTPSELANLRRMQTLAERYGVVVGFSGHEQGYEATVAAVFLGHRGQVDADPGQIDVLAAAEGTAVDDPAVSAAAAVFAAASTTAAFAAASAAAKLAWR